MAVQKITRRWLTGNFSVVLLVILSVIVGVSLAIQAFYYNGARQLMLSRADSVNTLLEGYVQDSSVDFSAQVRKVVEDFDQKERMELMAIGADAMVFITSSGFEPQGQLAMPDYQKALSSPQGVGEYIGRMEGEKILAITTISKVMGEDLSAMRYVVSLTRVDEQIALAIFWVAMLAVAVLLIVIFSSSYFISSIVNPIAQVGETARQIAQGDFQVRLPPYKDDEIGQLCEAINHMAEALSNSEQIKNDFISSVSHELRTPLTAIRGWGETLMRDQDLDPATLRKGIHVIMEETTRLSSMVEELLDFSRMQSGRFVLETQRIDLVSELSEAVLIFTQRARQEQKALVYEEPEEFAPVMGDKNRLRQVFVNVLDNALKYSDRGDSILVGVDIGVDTVTVTVQDTGTGISQEDLPNVKVRFYKGHTTRRGSGIGLAVADEIIEMHDGTLVLTSQKDVGTTVTITLPLAH